MYKFIEDNKRDVVGLIFVVLGVLVAFLMPSCRTMGEGMFTAGMLALNLQSSTKDNGSQ